ncbi:MAG: 1-acyl-sn-glycerol-3-phosphate acyltransferase [Saprospiraceae bacterium]
MLFTFYISLVKIFLFLFYETAKVLVWLVRWFYYAKRSLVNGGLRDYKGPCIVVSNHPGTLMDPLNVAVLMKRRVNFLANAGLFGNPFSNWFFSTFYCIKIERYSDTGGKPLNNKKAFKMAADHLTNDGCLYMAPEGGSHAGRLERQLKTGAARIALNTEEANDFNLGLVILPFGLNYSNPGQFRSSLMTVIGEPIKVSDFKEDWERDQIAAVRKLTAVLKERMEALLIIAVDEEEDQLLAKAEIILQNEEGLDGSSLLARSQKVLAKMQSRRAEQPAFYSSFKEKLESYFQKLKAVGIFDISVTGKKKIPILLTALAAPVFLLGYLIHFLPAYLTKKISDKLSTDPAWLPTFKVMGGLVVYPSTLVLQYWLASFCLSSFVEIENWWKWAYLASIVPAGLMAEWFIDQRALFCSNLRFRRFAKQQPAELERLMVLRAAVLSEIL